MIDNVPTSIKILSIFYWVKSGLFSLFIILPFLSFLGLNFGSIGVTLLLFDLLFYGGIIPFLILGALVVSLAVLMYFIGKGIRNGENNWRIIAILSSLFSIVLSILWILNSITVSFSQIFMLVISVVIIYFLKYNKKTKEFFNQVPYFSRIMRFFNIPEWLKKFLLLFSAIFSFLVWISTRTTGGCPEFPITFLILLGCLLLPLFVFISDTRLKRSKSFATIIFFVVLFFLVLHVFGNVLCQNNRPSETPCEGIPGGSCVFEEPQDAGIWVHNSALDNSCEKKYPAKSQCWVKISG